MSLTSFVPPGKVLMCQPGCWHVALIWASHFIFRAFLSSSEGLDLCSVQVLRFPFQNRLLKNIPFWLRRLISTEHTCPFARHWDELAIVRQGTIPIPTWKAFAIWWEGKIWTDSGDVLQESMDCWEHRDGSLDQSTLGLETFCQKRWHSSWVVEKK